MNRKLSQGELDAAPNNRQPVIAPAEAAPSLLRMALTAKEAAAALGLSLRTFRRGLATGRIPCGIRFGKRRLWPVDCLRAWTNCGMPPCKHIIDARKLVADLQRCAPPDSQDYR